MRIGIRSADLEIGYIAAFIELARTQRRTRG